MIDPRTWFVARFEFLRFFDVRGEIISLLILVALTGLRFGGEAVLDSSSDAPMRIATLTQDSPAFDNDGRFIFSSISATELDRSRTALAHDELDGLLMKADAATGYELLVHGSPDWVAELRELLQRHERDLRLQAAGIPPSTYHQIEAPADLRIMYLDPALKPKTPSVYGFAIAFIVLSLLGVIGCLSILVQGIAGEKFGHVSEMVLTALPAQVWLDGKIFAATLHGLKTILIYAAYTALAAVLMGFVKSSVIIDLLAHWVMVAMIMILCISGLLFWNCFFAFVAATLPSQQSAIRNTLPIIPLSFLLMSLSGAKHPQGPLLEFLSLFPPSVMTAMPVRLLHGDVPMSELACSLVALLASVVALRFLAARVFVYAIVSAGSSPTIMDYGRYIVRGARVAPLADELNDAIVPEKRAEAERM